jgi:hypothetical protein
LANRSQSNRRVDWAGIEQPDPVNWYSTCYASGTLTSAAQAVRVAMTRGKAKGQPPKPPKRAMMPG